MPNSTGSSEVASEGGSGRSLACGALDEIQALFETEQSGPSTDGHPTGTTICGSLSTVLSSCEHILYGLQSLYQAAGSRKHAPSILHSVPKRVRYLILASAVILPQVHGSPDVSPVPSILLGQPDEPTRLIPKIIHQTYINESVPARWQAAQQACRDLHPDYEYILWTDEASLAFIRDEYAWFLPTFAGYRYPIQRADAIRYFVLARYGGVYVDLDEGCNRRLDPLLAYPLWLRETVPTGISNNVMGAVPAHPLFLRTIASLRLADRNWILPYVTVMASTGPLFLTVIFKWWMSEGGGGGGGSASLAGGLLNTTAAAAAAAAITTAADDDWMRRVRIITFDEYNRHPWSYFRTYQGSSWHEWDAKYFLWIERNGRVLIALAVAAGLALVLSLVRTRGVSKWPFQRARSTCKL